MMLSSLVMLILAILLYNIFNEVNSAGLPNPKYLNIPLLGEEHQVTPKSHMDYANNFDYKFDTLNTIIQKMDKSLQDLHEKSNTWAIFQHHINSWNDGMRSIENKLDFLKRSHEEQQKQLDKLEFLVVGHHSSDEDILKDLKQLYSFEQKNQNDLLLKLNIILRHLQSLSSSGNNERKSSKLAQIMAPIGVPSHSSPSSCSNLNKRLEQQLNTLAHQMALQKDLKQLNSLEKRNSKSLENIHLLLNNHLDKQDEITIRLQKSNECCYSLASELTTFTESSDILLKRIEKLARDVSVKLNDIVTAKSNGEDQHDDDEEEENENKGSEGESEGESVEKEVDKNRETFSNEDVDLAASAEEHHELDKEEHSQESNDNDELDKVVTELFEYDDSHDVELIKPHLNGCHELIDELTDDPNDDSMRVDGIYKFALPDINDAERDFNERYCVFPHAENDTSGIPWTVIQRRGPYQQQENFNRSWSEYRNGFGHLSRDFWFGNEFIHRLVYNDDYELRIELEDFEGTEKWAEYSLFRIDSEKYNYNLLIGEYHGSVPDAMKYHNDNDFSTYDRRNDKTIDACCSCALGYASGWWFDNCSEANLNGVYRFTPLNHNYIGIMWELWRGDYSLKKTRMMIRPRSSNAKHAMTHSQDYHEYTEDP